jgi:hypothetical protein
MHFGDQGPEVRGQGWTFGLFPRAAQRDPIRSPFRLCEARWMPLESFPTLQVSEPLRLPLAGLQLERGSVGRGRFQSQSAESSAIGVHVIR